MGLLSSIRGALAVGSLAINIGVAAGSIPIRLVTAAGASVAQLLAEPYRDYQRLPSKQGYYTAVSDETAAVKSYWTYWTALKNHPNKIEFAQWVNEGSATEKTARIKAANRIFDCIENHKTDLDLSGLHLTSLPRIFLALAQLHTLNLSDNNLTSLPPDIGALMRLETLKLSGNPNLAAAMPALRALTSLEVDDETLLTLQAANRANPERLGRSVLSNQLHQWVLEAQRTSPAEVANRIAAKTRILAYVDDLYTTTLDLSNLGLTKLPDFIGSFTSLTSIHLKGNRLADLPPSFNRLVNLHTLDLSNNCFTTFEPITLSNLTSLNLSDNRLTSADFTDLTKLEALDLSRNQLTGCPPTIASLASLTSLNLSRNQMTQVDDRLGNLKHLRRLRLSGNKITSISPAIKKLYAITTLDTTSSLFFWIVKLHHWLWSSDYKPQALAEERTPGMPLPPAATHFTAFFIAPNDGLLAKVVLRDPNSDPNNRHLTTFLKNQYPNLTKHLLPLEQAVLAAFLRSLAAEIAENPCSGNIHLKNIDQILQAAETNEDFREEMWRSVGTLSTNNFKTIYDQIQFSYNFYFKEMSLDECLKYAKKQCSKTGKKIADLLKKNVAWKHRLRNLPQYKPAFDKLASPLLSKIAVWKREEDRLIEQRDRLLRNRSGDPFLQAILEQDANAPLKAHALKNPKTLHETIEEPILVQKLTSTLYNS